jgi:hypothetical protein
MGDGREDLRGVFVPGPDGQRLVQTPDAKVLEACIWYYWYYY